MDDKIHVVRLSLYQKSRVSQDAVGAHLACGMGVVLIQGSTGELHFVDGSRNQGQDTNRITLDDEAPTSISKRLLDDEALIPASKCDY